MSQKVLITGAAGFIGSAVAARLANAGMSVVGCDNFNDYYSPRLKHDRVMALLHPNGIDCLNVDLSNGNQVEKLFSQLAPDLVVHLAAQAGVRYSLQNPAAYIQSNLVAFGHVLECCRRTQVAHLLYASSSSVYGASNIVPFKENDSTDSPVSLYAATKKSNELMAYCYSHLYRLPTTGLRFFTVYGPWGRPDMAYFSFTDKMLAGESIPVYAGGNLERDFTYIDDIVEGVTRVLLKPPPGKDASPPHTVLNIGNHEPVRVLDFIKTLEDVLGVRACIDFQAMQAGDVPVTCADASKLHSLVGFSPSTPLREGLQRFAVWYRDWKETARSTEKEEVE